MPRGSDRRRHRLLVSRQEPAHRAFKGVRAPVENQGDVQVLQPRIPGDTYENSGAGSSAALGPTFGQAAMHLLVWWWGQSWSF